MKKFEYKSFTRELPDRWNELTTEQLLYICRLLERNLSEPVFTVAALRYLLKLPRKQFAAIHPADMQALAQATAYMLEHPNLTFQKLPTVRALRWFRFEGPESALTNCSFEQFFEYAETYYMQYLTTQQTKYLNLLIASLYVRVGDYFKPNNVEPNAKLIKYLPNHVKLAILIFYTGCRSFLAQKFPNVFSGSGTNNQQPDGLEFSRLIAQITISPAENPSVRKLNLYDALVFVEMKIETSKKK